MTNFEVCEFSKNAIKSKYLENTFFSFIHYILKVASATKQEYSDWTIEL